MKTNTIMIPVGFSVSKGIMFFTHENELLYNSYLELNSPNVSYIHFKDCYYHDLFEVSDEDITEGDYLVDTTDNNIHKALDINRGGHIVIDMENRIVVNQSYCKKIIASTDKHLTPDNLITKETVLEFIDNYKKEHTK